MKNLSLVINIILLIAVAYLYVLQFSGKEKSSGKVLTNISSAGGIPSIVYVNSDTLLERYTYYQDIRNKLLSKKDSLEKVLEFKGRKLEEEVKDYQQKAAGMTPSQRALIEDGLVKKEQKLYEQREIMMNELSQEESDLTDDLHKNLYGYLEKYNADKNFDYILGFQRGSGILHAKDSLDITYDVLKGLNAEPH